MEVYEMRPLLEKSYLKSRESWEQTRLLYGMLHKAWFKGDPKEMRFPWDSGKTSQTVTRKQAEELLQKMKAEELKMKKRRNG